MAEAATENDNQQEDVSRETSDQKQDLLLDSAQIEDTEVKEEDPISHRPEDEDLADDIEFERPEYYPDKFWDENEGPDVEGLVKSYNELEKKFHMGDHKPPKDGNYNLDFVEGKVEKDDEILNTTVEIMKKYNAPQAMVQDLVGTILEKTGTELERIETDNEEQMEILGPKAQELINNTGRMGANLHTKGVLSDEEYEEFKFMGNTALGVRVFNKIFNAYGEKNIPVVEASADIGVSDEELRAMVGDPRYKSEPAFRAKVEKMFEKRYPGEYKPG